MTSGSVTTVPTDWSARLARRTVGQDGVLTAILALANAEGVINFSGGFPDPELFPTELLAAITDRLLTDHSHVALQYSPSEGIATTLAAVADHLQALEGVRPVDGGVMMTSGGIDAVTLIAKSMLDPADVVLVEEPSYLGAVAGFAAFEATLRGVEMDDEGLNVDAVAQLLADGLRPKLLYTIPEYQNPSGYSMSLPRRRQLVELCRSHQVLIVEDVAYRELGFPTAAVTRHPSLWSLAPMDVVQIGTFSKTFFPGVRLGWATGPPQVITQLVVAKQNSDQCAGALGQRMVEEFIRGGHFDAHVTRARELYHKRGEATMRALQTYMPPDVTWTQPTGGFFTWLHVRGVDTTLLADVARGMDVAFVPGAAFFAERVENEYLRLSFSRVSEPDINEGVRRLAAAITTVREERGA